MNLLIMNKWQTDWTGRESDAPSIVGIMINLFLNFGETVDKNELPIIKH